MLITASTNGLYETSLAYWWGGPPSLPIRWFPFATQSIWAKIKAHHTNHPSAVRSAAAEEAVGFSQWRYAEWYRRGFFSSYQIRTWGHPYTQQQTSPSQRHPASGPRQTHSLSEVGDHNSHWSPPLMTYKTRQKKGDCNTRAPLIGTVEVSRRPLLLILPHLQYFVPRW